MPTESQLQTWLEQAYVARHKLSTGVLMVSFQHGDRRLTYNAADMAALDKYIAQLLEEIAQQKNGGAKRRRTYRVVQTGDGLT
ncbi:MAG: hypothetical protein BGP24_14660 [Lysobacterales bacterium 69-70]|nr:hypothetical protein [Xanthomonadaceae bacterium]ODU35330.1 MAG: hypothetical protein ABS97_05495 [Xanthomonadaceae bacterium SCN 69-320]ODV17206.1 MAG: hypothetical protein ABT27_17745 [Xanthomonadaceae bacterium SCN 69-25]OJY94226.1 MAG: hypothetical protein BGP24_14660 [Xanthomonadales bacterium 69-70]